jgi:hypothetical protein
MSLRSLFSGNRKAAASPASGVKVSFNGPCPFCGKMIEESDVDPCGITVTTKKGKWQTWSCHAACFKAKMVENPYLDISPAHF